jgi:hypothetical protein
MYDELQWTLVFLTSVPDPSHKGAIGLPGVLGGEEHVRGARALRHSLLAGQSPPLQ